MNSSLYGQLIFDKGGRNIKCRNNSLFTNGVGRSGQLRAKKMKLDHQLMPYTKIKSRLIKDLK